MPRGDRASGLFNADDWVPPKDQRQMDEFIVYALAAAAQAVEDSGWQPDSEEERERTGVMIGSGHRRPARHHRRRDHACTSAARAASRRSSSRPA